MKTKLPANYPFCAPWLAFALLLISTGLSAQGSLPFTDDFERATLGPEWTIGPYAEWSIQDGKAYNATEGPGGKLSTTQRFAIRDYAIETVAYPFEYGYWREYYLTFGEQDSPDSTYAIRYDAAYGGTLQIVKSTDNIYYPEVLASRKLALSDTAPLRFKVEHDGSGAIRLFVAEGEDAYPAQPLLEATDYSYPTLGRFGWLISTQTAAQDFFVESISAQARVPSPILFDDDFERDALGSLWEGSEGWSIRDGQAYNAPDDNGAFLTTAPTFGTTNYFLETEVSNLVTGYYREYFLLFGQQGALGEDCYVVNYDPDFGGILSLGRVSDNYFYPEILDDQVVRIEPDRAYRLWVARYASGLIQVYLGDENGFPPVPTLEAVDNTYLPLGRVSWACATQTAGEEFWVASIRAEATDIVKIEPEKPAEDAVIKQVLANSAHAYDIGALTPGATFYTDRTYTVTQVPAFLEGASFVKTANDDKKVKRAELLNVYLQQPAIAYVAYDPRGTQRPAWLEGWTKIEEVITTTDPGSDTFDVYAKRVGAVPFETYPYQLALGGNLAAPATGANMNYLVAFVPVAPSVAYEAEEAILSGAVVDTNHPGYSGSGFADYVNPQDDYVEWSVDISAPAPYALSLRYALGSQNPRSLLLSVDGQAKETIIFSGTGSWNAWANRSTNAQWLTAGNHRIRLTAVGSSGPNIDRLAVSPSDSYSPSASARTAHPKTAPEPSLTTAVGSAGTVYPNPAAGAVTFVLENKGAEGYLRITDLQGRMVHGERIAGSEGGGATRHHRLDVSRWQTGTYLYQIIRGPQVTNGKLVKQE